MIQRRLSAFPMLFFGFALTAFVFGCGVKPEPQPPSPVPTPVPVPVPVPVPPEPPAPVAVPAGVVVVEDTLLAGTARGLFLADKRVSAFFKSSQIAHAIYSTAAVGPDGKVPASAKKYIESASGKPLPYLFIVDAAGRTLKEQPLVLDAEKFLALFDGHNGQPRSLGLIPAKPRLHWKEFGTSSAPGTRLIPRAEWKALSLDAFLPPVYDQNGRGQCNASATCTAVEFQREVAGQSYVHLSAGDLYSKINGGFDRGSLLEDGLEAMTQNGVAPVSLVPYVWDGRRYETVQVKSSRASYRVTEAYLCPTFDHMASAVQQGFPVVHGLMWYDNFRVDSDGWLPETGRGSGGGHALMGYGLEKRSEKWGILTRNSWGAAWGMGGDCVIPECHFNGSIGGYWAIRSVVRTPETFPPPASLGRRRVTLSLAEGLRLTP